MTKAGVRQPGFKLPTLAIVVVLAISFSGTFAFEIPSGLSLTTLNLYSEITTDGASDGREVFERLSIPGITDREEDTAGVALADFNRDGLVDILAVYDKSRKIRLYLNQGNFQFEEHPIDILDSWFSAENIGKSAQIPNVVDFNGDGYLDIYLTRSRGLESNPTPGNSFLLSQGAFDLFIDCSETMGVRNFGSYSRQSSIGDVDGDGYLDIAVGADNIGNTRPGLPLHRLYVYVPAVSGIYQEGIFIDIGGNDDMIPEFGGDFSCNPDIDRGGPGITLRDLDDDGDLDLVQSYHMDMNGAFWYEDCACGEYDYGVYCWRNLLQETGEFKFERIIDSGLAEQGKLHYDQGLEYYVSEANAVGLPYLSMADVDNDGLLDILAVGPTDPEWHVNSDYVSGRFWRNQGGFQFLEDTSQSWLTPLNWFYEQWQTFWRIELPAESELQSVMCEVSNQFVLCNELTMQEHQIMGADTVFGDFNNDGWLDFLLVDRHEINGCWGKLRNVLFFNTGDGYFIPTRTEISGIDDNCIAAETADLNGDGLLDLFFVADPQNSYPYHLYPSLPPLPAERYMDKVYMNTGARGGVQNHWLRVRLSGVSDHEAVGAKVYAYSRFGDRSPDLYLVGMRQLFSNHSYKSGHGLEAHFGLGSRRRINIVVSLQDGRIVIFRRIASDQLVELNILTGEVTPVLTQ